MGEVVWIVIKLFFYFIFAYGCISYVSEITKEDRTIPSIIIASLIALFFFWANLK